MRAGDITTGYKACSLDTIIVRGGRISSEMNVTKSARFNEIGNVYLVGQKVLQPGLHSHVTV